MNNLEKFNKENNTDCSAETLAELMVEKWKSNPDKFGSCEDEAKEKQNIMEWLNREVR